MEDLSKPSQDETKSLQSHFDDNGSKIKASNGDSNIDTINKWR